MTTMVAHYHLLFPRYEGPRKPMIVAGLLTVIGLAHFGLALAFKLYFFNYVE